MSWCHCAPQGLGTLKDVAFESHRKLSLKENKLWLPEYLASLYTLRHTLGIWFHSYGSTDCQASCLSGIDGSFILNICFPFWYFYPMSMSQKKEQKLKEIIIPHDCCRLSRVSSVDPSSVTVLTCASFLSACSHNPVIVSCVRLRAEPVRLVGGSSLRSELVPAHGRPQLTWSQHAWNEAGPGPGVGQ